MRQTEKLPLMDISLLNAANLYGQRKFKAALQLYRSIVNDCPDNAEFNSCAKIFDCARNRINLIKPSWLSTKNCQVIRNRFVQCPED